MDSVSARQVIFDAEQYFNVQAELIFAWILTMATHMGFA